MAYDFTRFRQSNILVVGGAGFVGGNLVKRLLIENVGRITVVDNLMSAEKENVPDDERVEFIEASITDDTVLHGLEDTIDYIFHLATYHGNQSSIHDPLADHENNTLTTLKLFNRVKDFKNIKKVVYSSAGCSVAKKLYGETAATNEDDPINLQQDSPYSISKIIGEFYSLYYHQSHGLPTVRARFQNVYGPGEILGAGQWRGTPATVWRNVTPVFAYKAIKGIELPIQNKGIASRDFIYVEDIVEGLMLCALKGKGGEAYNLASGKETTIMALATMLIELSGSQSGITYLPPRPWDHSGNRFGSTEKSLRELGFSARVPLEEGLLKTIQWTKMNLDFIDSRIRKHRLYMESLNSGLTKKEKDKNG